MSKKSFICPYCGKPYRTDVLLAEHILHYHESKSTDGCLKGQHKCPHCPKTFSFKGALEDHIDKKHRLVQYHCRMPGCPRVFNSRSGRNRHEKIKHLGYDSKHYPNTQINVCPYCGKKIKGYYLQLHIELYHLKLYYCVVCNSYLSTNPWLHHKAKHACLSEDLDLSTTSVILSEDEIRLREWIEAVGIKEAYKKGAEYIKSLNEE